MTVIPYTNVLHDGLWMWGHETGVYDGPDGPYNIPVSEPIGMAHACGYMDIPNVCSVRWTPCDAIHLGQYRNMRRFGWVIANSTESKKTLYPFACSLVPEYENLTAFELDDFFKQGDDILQPSPDGGEVLAAPASQTLMQLAEVKQQMAAFPHPVELRAVLYSKQLRPSIVPALKLVDTVLLWTWDGADIAKLTANFNYYRELMPDKPTLLGIYMWDFGGKKPLEMGFMKDQLAAALEFWKRGDINGMIFHCTPLVNKNLPAVEYCREWIAEHKRETR